MGIFPYKETGCTLCEGAGYQPGEKGTLVYMDASPNLQIVQNRIKGAGGKVLIPKKQISPEHGYMCLFTDTKGNRLALHSMA